MIGQSIIPMGAACARDVAGFGRMTAASTGDEEAGGCLPLPERSVAVLQAVLAPLLRLVQIEARAVILAPEIPDKLRLARMLTSDIGLADALADRIAYLGGSGDIAAARLRGCPHGCDGDRACFRRCCADILAIAHEALPRLHPVWDRPSLDVLEAIATAQHAKLGTAPDDTPDETPDWAWDGLAGDAPLQPGRSLAFATPGPPPGWSDKPPLVRMTVEMLHFLLVQTEVPTIELCCSIICQFPGIPWKLSVDLAQQIADEVRHAQSCLDRLEALGGKVGQFSADLRIWRMTSPVGADLRLAIHQRIGEWIGVDALSWWADIFAQHGDSETGAMLKFMCADEINHVALGVRWLRALAGGEEAVWGLHAEAERIRLAAGEDIGSRGKYPFNEHACRQAGLTEREIAHLRALTQPPVPAAGQA